MTGSEFYLYLQQKYDKAYSGYLDTAKANRLIQETLYRLCDSLYRGMAIQKEFDELAVMLRTETEYTVTNNPTETFSRLPVSSLDNYLHLFRIAPVFKSLLNITGAQDGFAKSPCHNLRKGDTVLLDEAGVKNGYYTVEKITLNAFKMTGLTYTTGVIYQVRKSEGSPYFSDRKKSVFGKPSIEQPRYEIAGLNRRSIEISNVQPYTLIFPNQIQITAVGHGLVDGQTVTISGVEGTVEANVTTTVTVLDDDNFYIFVTFINNYVTGGVVTAVDPLEVYFKIYPQCDTAILDFMTNPPVTIDSNNNVIDLENTYTTKFLYSLMDHIIVNFATQTRDPEFRQAASQEVIENP